MRSTFAVALCATHVASLAGAQGFATDVIGDGGCFRRDYDAAHLAAHPAQRVTSIQLVDLPDAILDGPEDLQVRLDIETRPGPRVHTLTGYCLTDKDSMECLLDGGAGGLTAYRRDTDAMLIAVDPDGLTLPNDGNPIHLDGTAGDDGSFLLTRIASYCVD